MDLDSYSNSPKMAEHKLGLGLHSSGLGLVSLTLVGHKSAIVC